MANRIQPDQSSKYSLDTVRARIKPASETVGPFRGLVYARNKIGKTWLAGSSNLRTLLIDCHDLGTETIADRPNVDVFSIEEYQQIDEAFWFLKTQKHPYELFAVDNVTMLATLAMKKVLGDRSRDQVLDPLIPHTDQWNKVTQLLNNVFLEWQALPYHGLWLAQEQARKMPDPDNEGEKLEFIGPALSPAALGTLMGAVGTIGRLYTATVEKEEDGKTTRKIERRLLLSPRAPYIAGTRIHGVPRVMRNPTLQRILDIRSKSGEAPPTVDE